MIVFATSHSGFDFLEPWSLEPMFVLVPHSQCWLRYICWAISTWFYHLKLPELMPR